MNQVHTETETPVSLDSRFLEAAFKHLWERAREAGELINQLREENRQFGERFAALEQEVSRLKVELGRKEHDLKRLQVEHAELSNSVDGNNSFSPPEREALKLKIRELIARINSHL